MKNWLWTLLVIVGGYWAYRHWFASDEPAEAAPPALEVEKTEEAAAPPAEEKGAARPSVELEHLGAPAAAPADEGPAAQLAVEWRGALARADMEAARTLGEKLLREAPDSDAARWVHYERGREALRLYADAGKTNEGFVHARTAWLELTPVLFARDLAEEERTELRSKLRELARDLLFTRHVEGMDKSYVPKRGDSLSVLCAKVFPQWGTKLSPGFLVEINRLGAATNLRAGVSIRVPIGEPQIVIRKGEFRLYYLFAGGYVQDFPVGLGREGTTPEGTFTIAEMIRNPDWHPRAGVIIPYGDPRNILGSRWMAFRDTPEHQGFGIHGTTEPGSIGKEASSGCVRMLREDVERLFEWTPRGTRVEIAR
ncbi:MAG TPA: L,D-transpeptidase [Candidatus Eisenbacteria bacterium]|nr:L,D-transpeptidase [Candidatus Eisenbacteria bacterium]